MKLKLVSFVIITGICIFSFSLGASHFWRGETLSENEVARRWGTTELDIQKFKAGPREVRAEMTYSLLKNKKKFIGKTVPEIRSLFGPHDGFYFVDTFPAYLIQIAKTRDQEAWQIVFLLNNDRKVKDVIMHKNCCD